MPRLKAGDKSQSEPYTFTWGLNRIDLRAGGRTGVIEVRVIQHELAYIPNDGSVDPRVVRRKKILPESLTSGALEIDFANE